jgi:ubiquinone/menaquinone biosynthesis C-methylase UbiE
MSPDEHDIMRAVEDQYWWYQALRLHVADSIEPSSPEFTLLDAGCGTGGTLATLRQNFPRADLTGIDESEHALTLTAGRDTGSRLVRASVHELPFAEGSFDFVLSLDVWSHAGVDDTLAAHEAHRVLRAGGTLILNLAAFEFLKGAHDYATDVDRRYARRQVRALLEGANFQIERVTYWNALLTPPIALLRWFSRMRLHREQPRSDFRPLPPALELTASRHLSLPFGTSLLAVARKHG